MTFIFCQSKKPGQNQEKPSALSKVRKVKNFRRVKKTYPHLVKTTFLN
jgi:hypothetical protein